MQVIKLGDNIMTYFIHVFSLETHTYLDIHTYLDVRIQIRLWPEMFRVTDGRIHNGYMTSDRKYNALKIKEQSKIRVEFPLQSN